MRRFRRRAVVAAAALVVAVLAIVLTAVVPGLRTAAVTTALKVALRERGFSVRSGHLQLSRDSFDATNVEIDDQFGKAVFTADRIHAAIDPGVWLGRSERRYGLESVDVERPTLHLVRLADGSYNVSRLFSGASAPPTVPAPAPFRVDLLLRGGSLEFRNPAAPAILGRQFDVRAIEAKGRIDDGALTTLHVGGTYVAGPHRTPLSLAVVKNDRERFAQAKLTTGPIFVAPLVDGLVPTPVFSMEDGVIDHIELHAFSIDYDLVAGPQWQLSGKGELTRGRLRVVPLTVPVHDVSGALAFAGGHLSTGALDGTLEGSPVTVRGGLRLLGGVSLALALQSRQSLGDLRRAFAFSSTLDLGGPVDISMRVNGEPASVDVAGQYAAAGELSYAGIPVSALSGSLFYNGGHITLPSVRGEYDSAAFYLGGDIDLTTPANSASFDVLATMPARQLPIAANMNPDGTARAFFSLSGPIGALAGSGFTEIAGGNGTTVRAAASAGPQLFAIGPAIVSFPGGGELYGSFAIDRTTRERTISGEIVARAAALRLAPGTNWLPGINEASPVSLPAVSGTLGGTVFVRGSERAPSVFVNAVANDLTISGARLGRVVLVGNGIGGRVRIVRASISGPDADLSATGNAAVEPKTGRYAAELTGSGRANLGAFALGSPGAHMRGSASGNFLAALADRHWTVAVHATSADASLAGIRMNAVDASVGGGGGNATEVYAGTLGLSGGTVSAMGTVPAASRSGGELRVWSEGIDLKSVAPAGSRVTSGRAVGVARIGGSLSAPTITGAASVANARVGGQPFAGDIDLDYRGDRLVASNGRIAIGGGFAQVNGSISGLGPGKPASGATLFLDASMREGDLGALAGRYMPNSLQLRGTVAATLRVTGTLAAPRAAGFVDADTGTLQGVAFEDLRGSVAASTSDVQVSGGSVGFGSSHFAFSGRVSPSAVHISASSARVDLADFNDFFAGYDTLEGRGYGAVAFQSTRTGVLGSGSFSITNASVVGFPLGTVNANFSNGRDQLLAHVRQNGDAGSSDLRGSVTFAPRRNALPDPRLARYDVHGSVRGADIGRIAPLMGKESLGLSGFVDVDGSLRGNLRSPTGRAVFTLRDGHIGKVAITAARGSVETDGKVVAVRNAAVTLPFAHLDGEGTIGPGNRISASAGIDASDLSTIFALGGRPGVATGSALASVTVSGTLAAPRVATTIVSGHGSALGVGFDRLSGKVAYAPGEVDIADTEIEFSGNRGVITIGGTLPLRLQPFGLGPKEKRVDLSLTAKSVVLSALDPLTSGLANLTGTLNASGNLSGTAGRPQVTGSAQLRGASASSPFETVPADHIDADLSLARDTLTLTRLRANLGRGTLAGTGAIHIVPAVGLLNVAGLQYWMRLNLHDAQINVPGWTSGSVNGNLHLTKSGAVPYLAGDITLDDGTVPFSAIYKLASGYGSGPAPEAGPLPGLPELRPGHIVVYGGSVFGAGGPYVLGAVAGVTPAPTGPKLPSVDLAVTAKAGRNVRVHGGAIDLTASGSVLIGGNVHSPTFAGTFSSTRGQIGYFDTNFRLVRGTVLFDPVEGLLPTLDVRAITNLSGAEITLTVTGRVDNLQTELSSNPSMSRDEIVATLLHAPQVASVFGSTPGQAGTALYGEAQSYFNAQLTRSLLFPVESLLAQTINVEQISLIYDQQGKVDVEIRKLITPTVYAIYRSSLNIPVTQTAGVAYSLRDYADLEILQTSSSSGLQQSVLNLRLTFH